MTVLKSYQSSAAPAHKKWRGERGTFSLSGIDISLTRKNINTYIINMNIDTIKYYDFSY